MMSDLFVVADRLLHDPDDPSTRRALASAVLGAAGTEAPYGMDAAWWTRILDQAQALKDASEAMPLDEEALLTHATELRENLRPFV
jgi:hypothetical protein